MALYYGDHLMGGVLKWPNFKLRGKLDTHTFFLPPPYLWTLCVTKGSFSSLQQPNDPLLWHHIRLLSWFCFKRELKLITPQIQFELILFISRTRKRGWISDLCYLYVPTVRMFLGVFRSTKSGNRGKCVFLHKEKLNIAPPKLTVIFVPAWTQNQILFIFK